MVKKTTKKTTKKKKEPEFDVRIRIPSCDDYEQDDSKWYKMKRWYYCSDIRTGVSFGSALAMVLSYSKNSSILWAILHGILSWLYVIYFAAMKVGWF